jgi:hypothetical protein
MRIIYGESNLWFFRLAAKYGGMCSYEQFIIDYNRENNVEINDDHM